MGFYRNVILPKLCDASMKNERLAPFRERVIGGAEGRVLEIGAGSGRNLPLYGAGVDEVIALEPDASLTRMAEIRAKERSRPVEWMEASAEEIPLENGSVDTAVSTWTMCSIPHLTQALREMRRVLKPGGRLLFVEHGLSPEPRVQKWQNLIDPLWSRISGGCHLNRPIRRMIEDAGFQIERVDTCYLPGPKSMGYFSEGSARPG